MPTSFYVPESDSVFDATTATTSPWGADTQHGGPPAALLGRALEQLDPDRVVGRITVEILGPIFRGPMAVSAQVVRPGRTVVLAEATLTDVTRDRPVARATAWLFPTTPAGASTADAAPGHSPAEGRPHPRPPAWGGGYLESVEWRWVSGSIDDPGPAVVWMRPRIDLVEGEVMSPIQRLLTCADSASGVSAVLDLNEWTFLNTELTVHLLRPPAGEWVCVAAQTVLGPGSVGVATSDLYDQQGLLGRSAQTLLVARR